VRSIRVSQKKIIGNSYYELTIGVHDMQKNWNIYHVGYSNALPCKAAQFNEEIAH